jgi:hypothetical protein
MCGLKFKCNHDDKEYIFIVIMVLKHFLKVTKVMCESKNLWTLNVSNHHK